MKSSTIWGLSLGIGIPGALILIGLLGLLIKFFMKRCRTKAWDDISSPPKQAESVDNPSYSRKAPKRSASDRQPLYQSGEHTSIEVSEGHISIPVSEAPTPTPTPTPAAQQDQTLVQIQRNRLIRLKEEENRIRPMLQLNRGELDIQQAIDQAQKEFDESV